MRKILLLEDGWFEARTNLSERDDRELAIDMAISHLESYPDDLGVACRVLASVDTPDAARALLRLYATASKCRIDDEGEIVCENEGEWDHASLPADALTSMKSGIESAKKQLSTEKFEEFLIRAAHANSAKDVFGVIASELSDLATPRAIQVLISSMWNQYDINLRAISALTSVGNSAVPALCRSLETSIAKEAKVLEGGNDIEAFKNGYKNYRRGILNVLGKIGNATCHTAVLAMWELPSVRNDAEMTLRKLGRDVPKAPPPPMIDIKQIAKTGDAYADSCFAVDYKQFREDRGVGDIPGAKQLPYAWTSGDEDGALLLAKELQRKHPDHYFSYYWMAYINRRRRRFDEGRAAAMQGIEHARSKEDLFDALAEIEFDSENLALAVNWWIRSAVIRTSMNLQADWDAFLYLSYVARQLGLNSVSSSLRDRADKIGHLQGHGPTDLTSEAANRIYALARQQGNESMCLTLKTLEQEFL